MAKFISCTKFWSSQKYYSSESGYMLPFQCSQRIYGICSLLFIYIYTRINILLSKKLSSIISFEKNFVTVFRPITFSIIVSIKFIFSDCMHIYKVAQPHRYNSHKPSMCMASSILILDL